MLVRPHGVLFQLIAPPDQRLFGERIEIPPPELVVNDPADGVYRS
jgi:hypothetical protein